MTFPNDGTYVIKKECSDEEILAVLVESRQARNYKRKLGKVTETVAAYRLKNKKTFKQESSWLPGGGLMVTIELKLTIISGLAVHSL